MPWWLVGGGLAVVGAILMVAAFVGGGSSSETTPTATAVATTVSPFAPDLGSGTTAPLGSVGLGEDTVPERQGRSPLAGFGEAAVTITSEDGKVCEVCLLAATTEEQRARGLMEVTDPELGGYDGMIFEYPNEISGAFWMRNTPMPLSIAYFDDQGTVVSTVDMEPCHDEPDCPSYPADGPFQFAIEVPQGRLADLGITGKATLRIDARTCPLAGSGS